MEYGNTTPRAIVHPFPQLFRGVKAKKEGILNRPEEGSVGPRP